ncbi:TIGR01548 family HAD-type hydrolase [Trichocoleus sp. DQ-A3]|uniref:TIGR01548 family HAD-type hydrolase n=1 Tax=Cyanophyceae TaxID=3028117 RepID=UPI001686F579|nr:TIGR01548 family HAD-type hydrolase [Coleofasciculus sp. FACHB-129]MBD1899230.1 TIGR01548 family HAD-type hydrolase [Coleofasciculus sp. FACHB-125]MBD2539106.1 TIGR01548 family HAD-type hydrolase [Coleofasciculus sp. FACHB-SPT36]
MVQESSCLSLVVFDIDGVVRDVGGSYRRALADTVEQFTEGAYRPTPEEIDHLKLEGMWNNDWEASQELVYRYFESAGQKRSQLSLDYDVLVAFFQSRYRGPDPHHWTGYICDEPLLLQPSYLEQLTAAGIPWGFFSGATRGSANYVLEQRLGLKSPLLIAMEDAPGKPDPTGLFAAVQAMEERSSVPPSTPVIYVGDTVADIYTIEKARSLSVSPGESLHPDRRWIAVGILPPHVQENQQQRDAYANALKAAGAAAIFSNVQELTPVQILQLVNSPE